MDNSTFLISNYPACYYLSSFILGGRPINSAMYSCPVCLTSFSTKYNRNRHINAQHNPSFQGFKCNCCRKTFTRKSQLSIHKRGRCHGSIPSGEESVVTSCQHGGVLIDHSDTRQTITRSKLLYPTPLKTVEGKLGGYKNIIF